MTTEEESMRLFNGFPEPVLLLRDGLVCYRNGAAAERFSGLREGEPLPQALERLLDGASAPALVTGILDGWSCTATLQKEGEGTLVVLRAGESVPGVDAVARQLRREMTSFAVAIQRLDPEEGKLDEAQKDRYLSVVHQGLYRLLRLADHLELAGGAVEEGWSPQGMDLAGLCREVAEEVEGVCRLAGYDFTWELEDASLLTVGDERLLRQMTLSLISNAMKAAGKQGKLGLKLSRRGKLAVLTVWNTGRELDEQMMTRFLGSGVRSMDVDQGLGLGMEVVRRTAAVHGGAVLVQGQDGVIRCAVSLPIRTPEVHSVLQTPKADYSGGFSTIMVELSDVLPPELYNFDDLQ